jgi:hypothetical protein
MNITIIDTMNWSQNKLFNPITKHRIKLNCKTYKLFENKYNEFFPNKYSFIDSIEDRDPISFELFYTTNNGIKHFIYKNLEQLVLYQDDMMKVHCFEKTTLEHMKHYNISYHPITMEKIPDNIFNNTISINIDKSISDRIYNIFNSLTTISIFLNSELFLKLNNIKLDKLYYETRDFYLNNLSTEIIKKLNIFIKTTNEYNIMTFINKQEYIVNCYEILLKNSGGNHMFYYIIVGGLSTVVSEIKELYPDIIILGI